MTGIIICDKCGKVFLAHGKLSEPNKPTPILRVLIASKMPRFKGTRKIVSEKIGDKTISKFKDYCSKCEK